MMTIHPGLLGTFLVYSCGPSKIIIRSPFILKSVIVWMIDYVVTCSQDFESAKASPRPIRKGRQSCFIQ